MMTRVAYDNMSSNPGLQRLAQAWTQCLGHKSLPVRSRNAEKATAITCAWSSEPLGSYQSQGSAQSANIQPNDAIAPAKAQHTVTNGEGPHALDEEDQS